MKASEARSLSKAAKSPTNQILNIIEKVKEEAGKGNFFAWIYTPIDPQNRAILENEGYTFSEENFSRNEYLIKIS